MQRRVPWTPALDTPGIVPNDVASQEERVHARHFIKKLLEAYVASGDYAKERFNLGADPEPARGFDNYFFRGSRNELSTSMHLERTIKQLYSLHRHCIEGMSDKFARLLLNDARLHVATRRARIQAALAEDSPISKSAGDINIPDAFRVLQLAAERFREQYTGARNNNVMDGGSGAHLWKPDWRTQNLVWALIKRMGDIVPPPILLIPYQELKEAAFACLFECDFIDKQWQRCSFRQTLLRYIPRPYHWDADVSWIGLSFFVSLPLTGFVHSFDRGLRLPVFWGLFFTIFFSTSAGIILFYSSYRSRYATELMRKASCGTSYAQRYSPSFQINMSRILSAPYDLVTFASPPSKENSNKETESESESLDAELATVDNASVGTRRSQGSAILPEAVLQPGPNGADQAAIHHAFFESSDDTRNKKNDSQVNPLSPAEAIGFGANKGRDSDGFAGATLRLYQASMFVQRIYGSTFFDESWSFGLSESQLHEAVKFTLQTDSSLGRQFAAFSFAAIAVASRAVQAPGQAPTPASNAALRSAFESSLFSFGIFSYLGALTFVCGLTSAILADLILRQMAFTQISREGTAHGFIRRFGFFIRVVGGLNSTAGMFLSTAVLHFLLSIFKVHPAAVLPLSFAWLLLGTMVVESFFSNYHFWRMSEILDDVTLIAEPDVRSPSPMTGVMQILMAQIRKIVFRKKKEREENP